MSRTAWQGGAQGGIKCYLSGGDYLFEGVDINAPTFLSRDIVAVAEEDTFFGSGHDFGLMPLDGNICSYTEGPQVA